jgi:hypothetical protein
MSASSFSFNFNSNIDQDSRNHRLRLFETNFDQLSISYYTDKQLVNKCIELYKEKFQKLDSKSDDLFNSFECVLNHLTYLLLNNTEVETNSNLKEKIAQVQENLLNLNSIKNQLRKNKFNLVTATSFLSAMKQESHLSDMINLSINYVKELKNSANSSTVLNKSSKVLPGKKGLKKQANSFDSSADPSSQMLRRLTEPTQKSIDEQDELDTDNAATPRSSRHNENTHLNHIDRSLRKNNQRIKLSSEFREKKRSNSFCSQLNEKSSNQTSLSSSMPKWLASISFIKSLSKLNKQNGNSKEIKKSVKFSSSTNSKNKEEDSSSFSNEDEEFKTPLIEIVNEQK